MVYNFNSFCDLGNIDKCRYFKFSNTMLLNVTKVTKKHTIFTLRI